MCVYTLTSVSMSFTSIYGKDIAEPHAQSHTPKKDMAETAILFTKTLMARRLRSPKAMGSQTMDFTLLLWHNAEAKTIFPRSQIQTTPWRYGGHLRPYLSVTCDPTPLKPETRSLATLPLFTAPTTQNYTWSLATLPTTTRENTTRSLATLPTQIGRVTSDH